MKDDRNFLILAAMIIFALLAIVGAGVADDIWTHNHVTPDMSKCELATTPDGKNAWYECPYSMGV